MDISDVQSFFSENSVRPSVPGEVWKFDALEAHSFFDIFMALSFTGLISKENPIVRSYLESFKVVNDAYNLSESDIEIPPGIKVTPTMHDYGFFSGLVPFYKIFVEAEYARVEKHDGEHEHECGCGNSDCDRKYELPCGHSAKEHLTILIGWYEREIAATEKFTVSRRAVETVPYEQRYMGKPIIARSDMERKVLETVKKQLDIGLYTPELTEELIQSIIEATGQSREDSEKLVARMRENLARDMREDLLKKNEKEYRIIDI